jgi:hypothetical protein
MSFFELDELLGAQAKFETDGAEGSCGKQIDWARCEGRMALRRDEMQKANQVGAAGVVFDLDASVVRGVRQGMGGVVVEEWCSLWCLGSRLWVVWRVCGG